MAENRTLVQRIALDGGDEIKRELLALGKAGEQAFAALQRQANQSKAATTGLNADLLTLRTRLVAVGTAARQVGSNFSFLGGAVGQLAGAFATVFSVQTFINLTTAWTDLSSRIKIATGDTKTAADTMERLTEIANRTYSSLQTTADTFASNAVVLNALGISTQKQLDLQESLNNAIVISGARGEAAAQIQRAFTNAMSLGALRGEDFNNVLKRGSAILPLLAKAMGVTVDQLKALADKGLITASVFQDALLGNFDQLRAAAEAMPATISDAFIRIQNSLLSYVGTADQAAGASAFIAQGLIAIADNLHIIIPAMLSLAAAFLTVKAINLAKDIFGLVSAFVALLPAIVNVTLALARNPIGLIAVAVAALVVAIIQATGGFENFGTNVLRVAKIVADALWPIVEPVLAFIDAIGGAIAALAAWLGLTAPEEAKKAEDALGKVDGITESLSGTFKAAGVESASLSDATVKGMDAAATAVDKADKRIQNLANTFENLQFQISGAAENATKLFNELSAAGGSSGSFQTLSGGGADSIQQLAGGGPVRGPGSGTSDSILARLSNGEFVMKARAVRKWGIGALNRLNRGLPAFASGGLVSVPRMGTPIPAFKGGAGGGSGRPLSLSIGGETFDGLIAPDTVAEKLTRFATGKALRRSGLTPSWYK